MNRNKNLWLKWRNSISDYIYILPYKKCIKIILPSTVQAGAPALRKSSSSCACRRRYEHILGHDVYIAYCLHTGPCRLLCNKLIYSIEVMIQEINDYQFIFAFHKFSICHFVRIKNVISYSKLYFLLTAPSAARNRK